MVDFVKITHRQTKQSCDVFPKFIIKHSEDLMIRGSDFYAVWLEDKGLWSTDEQDVVDLIDRELDKYVREHLPDEKYVNVKYMWDSESHMIDAWHRYVKQGLRDNFTMLDEKLVFQNTDVKKEDYVTKRLPYALDHGDMTSYEMIMSKLYSPEERHKIEWAIGAIVSGDSKSIQKFMVLYGAAGTGKSTVLNIIQMLFDGYWTVFDAKALGSSSNSFALEPFKTNPLVAIQHDGDLSNIDDNTRLNSLVSHEKMSVNEKFKGIYVNDFKCFLFMGTNKPVRITDAKSGLIRRLIDVSPTGEKLAIQDYRRAMSHVKYELGAIAAHCLDIYNEDPHYYDDYKPLNMLGATNYFYDFVLDSYPTFKAEDGTTLKAAWEMYKNFCDEANIVHMMPRMIFKEELKNYFKDYTEGQTRGDNGNRPRNVYSGFKLDKFEKSIEKIDLYKAKPWITEEEFIEQSSILDEMLKDFPAQYARNDKPQKMWDDITTKLSDIDTACLHYVRPPIEHIVIDFDIPDEDGKKCLVKNIEAAQKWPKTYAELSKSGQGIHLHYLYTGDVEALSSLVDDNIEVKKFTGKSSLRRKLSKCINNPVGVLTSGLPLKGEKKGMVDFDSFQSEAHLRNTIRKYLNKEILPNTKPCVDMIAKCLEQAYNSGMKYDISDMRNEISNFATNSTHQSQACLKTVMTMKFKSDDISTSKELSNQEIVFFDVEVFPNLFIVCWKIQGEGHQVVRMINPSPQDIETLMRFKLVGFNCRRYDNHILYGRLLGYSNEDLYRLSQRIVTNQANCYFGQAYNISYTDIYDFSSLKQSLKQFEIDLNIHHKELGLPWDQPVPEDKWELVASYCDNDVYATEAVFNARQADFTARQILAELADMTVNDTTNSLTTKIIFGNDRKPQSQFNYRDMGDESVESKIWRISEDNKFFEYDDEFTKFDDKGRPIFPGYRYSYDPSIKHSVSTYRGEEVGEGGYVYAEPGIYYNVALLDIASMHPSSIIAEQLFGETYSRRFQEIRDARIAIKHEEFDRAKTMMDGKLAKFIQRVIDGELTSKQLANALKIAINSVYGLTAAKFDNAFRDNRNVDNIVAKRGALFMVNLKHEVQKRGFTVAHIKTDSIKIPNATPEIIKFVQDYGEMYGYSFEHEATYERMCLVNESTYIAKYADGSHEFELPTGEKIETPWTATGAEFQVPYVFKTLFAKAPINFRDMCETKSVTSALYLDMNEDKPDDHNYTFVGKCGSFCPIKDGAGGGLLLRESKAKDGTQSFASATGAKGYKWLESETVRLLGKEGDIDKKYYQKLVDDARESIDVYGDVEAFASDSAA